MTQTWVDGLHYSLDFGPGRAIAVVVNLDTMLAQAFLYANSDYNAYKAKSLPLPLVHRPVETVLTLVGHVAMANRLEKLLKELHGAYHMVN